MLILEIMRRGRTNVRQAVSKHQSVKSKLDTVIYFSFRSQYNNKENQHASKLHFLPWIYKI
jgi:hypothetical protein